MLPTVVGAPGIHLAYIKCGERPRTHNTCKTLCDPVSRIFKTLLPLPPAACGIRRTGELLMMDLNGVLHSTNNEGNDVGADGALHLTASPTFASLDDDSETQH